MAATAARATRRRRAFALLQPIAALLTFVAVWVLFYGVGQTLLAVTTRLTPGAK